MHADGGMQMLVRLRFSNMFIFWICFCFCCVIPIIIFRNSTGLNYISYLTTIQVLQIGFRCADSLTPTCETREAGATKWLCRNWCKHENRRRKNEDQPMIMCIQFVIQLLYCYASRASLSHWIQMAPIYVVIGVSYALKWMSAVFASLKWLWF